MTNGSCPGITFWDRKAQARPVPFIRVAQIVDDREAAAFIHIGIEVAGIERQSAPSPARPYPNDLQSVRVTALPMYFDPRHERHRTIMETYMTAENAADHGSDVATVKSRA